MSTLEAAQEDEFDTPFGRLDLHNLLELFRATIATRNHRLIEETEEKIGRFILSEAHRVSLEAIGPDYIDLEDDTDPHTEITLKWMNFEKSQQRQRLSKITGIEGSKEQ